MFDVKFVLAYIIAILLLNFYNCKTMTDPRVHKLFQQKKASLVQEQKSELSKLYEELQTRHVVAASSLHHKIDDVVNQPLGIASTAHLSVKDINQKLGTSSTSVRGAFMQKQDKDDEELTKYIENFVESKKDIRLHQDKSNVERMMLNAFEFHKVLYNYVESRVFTGFIMTIIMLNTMILVAQTWEIVNVRMGWYFSAADSAFFGIYVMEIVLKLYVFRQYFFYEGWNILDLSIVLFNLVDFILPLIIQNVGGFNGAAIFRLLRIFRAVRAIRALRVLRTIRFLSHLQVIMATCLQSMQSMGAIVGLISLFMYLFAVIGRGLYAEDDPDRFGSLASAGFTLFQLLTLDDWFYIYRDMVNQNPGNWHILFYLLLYIVVEYFIFLNLFVAVLVDNFQLTLEAANQEKKQKKKKREEEEEEDDAGYELTESAESESDHASEASLKIPGKSIYETYPNLTGKEVGLLHDHFQLMTAIEYNSHIIRSQQRTLDMMVDLCQETMDDEL